MHLTRRVVLVLALALVGLLALAPSASADTDPAAGSFTETPETILEERQADGNTFVHLTRDAFITGTYTGIGHADQYAVIHKDGSLNFHQTIEFVGTACGVPVTLTFRNVGQGDLVAGTLSGTYSIIGPTEVGRGSGTITGVPGFGGTYEGQVHC